MENRSRPHSSPLAHVAPRSRPRLSNHRRPTWLQCVRLYPQKQASATPFPANVPAIRTAMGGLRSRDFGEPCHPRFLTEGRCRSVVLLRLIGLVAPPPGGNRIDSKCGSSLRPHLVFVVRYRREALALTAVFEGLSGEYIEQQRALRRLDAHDRDVSDQGRRESCHNSRPQGSIRQQGLDLRQGDTAEGLEGEVRTPQSGKKVGQRCGDPERLFKHGVGCARRWLVGGPGPTLPDGGAGHHVRRPHQTRAEDARWNTTATSTPRGTSSWR